MVALLRLSVIQKDYDLSSEDIRPWRELEGGGSNEGDSLYPYRNSDHLRVSRTIGNAARTGKNYSPRRLRVELQSQKFKEKASKSLSLHTGIM